MKTSTHTLTVTGGSFSGNIPAGSKVYDTTAYFNMKAKQTGYADGPTISSYSKDGYFTMNNRPAAFATPTYSYTNGTALRKTDSCTVTCAVSMAYNPLYKYTCEEGTDLAVQGGDTTSTAKKT